MTTLWPALIAPGPISGTLSIPGSKSVTNRALVLAAQSCEISHLRRPLRSRDTELMAAGLEALGFGIATEANGDWTIGSTRAPSVSESKIDVGNAGTVMRFLPPLAALTSGTFHFDGDARSHERPLGPVIDALRHLGAEINDGNRGSLPFTLTSKGALRGGTVEIDASASSQFVSALLLIGPSTELGIRVRHIGTSLPSQPHIDMTIQMLRQSGVVVEVGNSEWFISPGKISAQNYVVEPDLSNAAPFLAAALITGGEVTIHDWPKVTTQPGDQLRTIFEAMGGKISFTDNGLCLRGGEEIRGIDIDLHDVGELTPIIAAVAALAGTPSHLRGIGHLRLHETDRLASLATEINSLGGEVIEHPTSLEIRPSKLHGGTFHTYEDHRLATAGAVLGLLVPGIHVENMETVGKTMPTFPTLWHSLVSGA